jgi:L-threonylcarbamoyladenylate synthase
MPRHPLALNLIERAGVPIAAPSANPFGHTSPTTARHVLDQMAGKVDMVLDGGDCSVGVESTIVSFATARPVLLRPGGLPVEDIEAIVGPLGVVAHDGNPAVVAPGMLPRHYAPRTPVKLISSGESWPPNAGERVGWLAFQKSPGPPSQVAVEVLSAEGDLREAAVNLFAALRRLDALGLDVILAQTVPDAGLGRAINDRLLRATGHPAAVAKEYPHA